MRVHSHHVNDQKHYIDGTVDLLSDKDFDSLLDEASKGAQPNLLNDDDFDK